jgi:hypothetical protein
VPYYLIHRERRITETILVRCSEGRTLESVMAEGNPLDVRLMKRNQLERGRQEWTLNNATGIIEHNFEGRRILAEFVPQVYFNGHVIDSDETYQFDATEAVLKLGREAALAIRDRTEAAEDLWSNSLLSEQKPWPGPFTVLVEADIQEYFKQDERQPTEEADRRRSPREGYRNGSQDVRA